VIPILYISLLQYSSKFKDKLLDEHSSLEDKTESKIENQPSSYAESPRFAEWHVCLEKSRCASYAEGRFVAGSIPAFWLGCAFIEPSI